MIRQWWVTHWKQWQARKQAKRYNAIIAKFDLILDPQWQWWQAASVRQFVSGSNWRAPICYCYMLHKATSASPIIVRDLCDMLVYLFGLTEQEAMKLIVRAKREHYINLAPDRR